MLIQFGAQMDASPVFGCLEPILSFQTCPFREFAEQREGTKKTSSTFFTITSASSTNVASHSSPSLKCSIFDHSWAQSKLVVDLSSTLAYNLYSLPAFVCGCGFSSFYLWDWRTDPAVVLRK